MADRRKHRPGDKARKRARDPVPDTKNEPPNRKAKVNGGQNQASGSEGFWQKNKRRGQTIIGQPVERVKELEQKHTKTIMWLVMAVIIGLLIIWPTIRKEMNKKQVEKTVQEIEKVDENYGLSPYDKDSLYREALKQSAEK